MKFQNWRRQISLVMLYAIAPISSAACAEDTKEFAITTTEQIVWQDVPDGFGTQFAIIRGNPAGPGLYVIRVKFPPHIMDTPHFHPNDRYVTVLKGTWYAGTGSLFDISKATKLTAGSFMFHPGGGYHWDGSAGDEEVIVEVFGEGPGSTQQLDQRHPMWVRVK